MEVNGFMRLSRSAKVAHKRFLRNRSVKRTLRTVRTRAERALVDGDVGDRVSVVNQALGAMDKAATKGVIHRNKAARLKSRLAHKLNAGHEVS